MISLDNLTVSYGGWTLFDNISFLINPKDRIGLVGRNGAGKTTSFYMLTGIIKPSSGRVLLEDQDIGTWPLHERARVGISYLPQESSVFRKLKKHPVGLLSFRAHNRCR